MTSTAPPNPFAAKWKNRLTPDPAGDYVPPELRGGHAQHFAALICRMQSAEACFSFCEAAPIDLC